jgi:methyl-accepting chemotaxis protein
MTEKKDNYKNLPLSKLTLEGSNFNINDIKVLKVFNDRQDQIIKQYISDTYDLHAKLICDAVRGMLNEIKDELILIHAEIKEIRTDLGDLHSIAGENRRFINELRKVTDDHESRIDEIEKRLGV